MIRESKTINKIILYRDIIKNKTLFNSKKTVLVGGCFDLLHYGHIVFLNKAKEQGDLLVIALESDQSLKKKRLAIIHNQQQRAEILASLNMINLVIKLPFFSSDKEYFKLVKQIHPKIIATTESDEQITNKRKQANLVGAEVRIVTSRLAEFSSSKLIKKYETIFGN